MYTVKATNRFKKDLKTVIKRGYNTGIMDTVISNLANGNELDAKYCDHNLHGEWEGCRECHVLPDWLLIFLAPSVKNTSLFCSSPLKTRNASIAFIAFFMPHAVRAYVSCPYWI